MNLHFFTAPFSYFKIFFHIIHEDLDRRRLEHGLLEDEVARAQDRALLAVVDHFAIDIRRTLREKVCGMSDCPRP